MAISRAAMTGVRNGVTNTLGPNLRRVVRAATAAIAVIGSGTGSGDDSRSENQTRVDLALLAELDEAPEEVAAAPGRPATAPASRRCGT